jgi:uncharacterized LabA/DUF88 family protein
VLVDGDFVPAAKLARREGIDFVLGPMWQPIRDDLFEHIDGLRSACRRPGSHAADSDSSDAAAEPAVDPATTLEVEPLPDP